MKYIYFVTIIFIILIVTSCETLLDIPYEAILNNKVYGKSYIGKSLYWSYESGRSFHGDGVSYEEYLLRDEESIKIIKAKIVNNNLLPQKTISRMHWKEQTWIKGDKNSICSNDYYKFVINELAKDTVITNDLDVSLISEDTYFSYFYNESPKTYIRDVDFFIIDFKNKKLYIFNKNT
jgi:hypothetical protein